MQGDSARPHRLRQYQCCGARRRGYPRFGKRNRAPGWLTTRCPRGDFFGFNHSRGKSSPAELLGIPYFVRKRDFAIATGREISPVCSLGERQDFLGCPFGRRGKRLQARFARSYQRGRLADRNPHRLRRHPSPIACLRLGELISSAKNHGSISCQITALRSKLRSLARIRGQC